MYSYYKILAVFPGQYVRVAYFIPNSLYISLSFHFASLWWQMMLSIFVYMPFGPIYTYFVCGVCLNIFVNCLLGGLL